MAAIDTKVDRENIKAFYASLKSSLAKSNASLKSTLAQSNASA
jgi:hypothetical protein